MSAEQSLVPMEAVQKTIDGFTQLDATGDRRRMDRLARRLGRDQPALLSYAVRLRDEHDEATGEAAVFYATLVWAMFDQQFAKKLPRLLPDNIESAESIVNEAIGAVEGVGDKPLVERVAPDLVGRQPHIYAKLAELIAEDVTEDAMTAACAKVVYPATQVILEAFDAAIDGRRPGQRIGPITRDAPKIGRNDPCSCGSGKKYKRCCGAA